MYIDAQEKESFNNFSSYRQFKFISVTVPLILIIVGSFGNIMVLIVLYRHARTISTYLYLISLAFADQMVLWLSMMPTWLEHMFGIHLLTLSSVTCKTFLFAGTSFSQMAVWLIVVVTVERMIVVAMPLQAQRHTTVTHARICVCSVILIFFAINLHFFFTVDVRYFDSANDKHDKNETVTAISKMCDFKPQFAKSLLEIWSWADAVLYSYLPCIIIIFANVVIIRYLRKAHQQRQMMQFNQKKTTVKHNSVIHSRQSVQNSHSSQQLLMLILVSWVFLFTIIPVSIFKMSMAIIHRHFPDFLSNEETNAKFHLVNGIVAILMTTNHSINFFLYCIAGKKFRKDFTKLFGCYGVNQAQERYSQVTNNSVLAKNQRPKSICKRKTNKNVTGNENQRIDSKNSYNNIEIVIGLYTEV